MDSLTISQINGLFQELSCRMKILKSGLDSFYFNVSFAMEIVDKLEDHCEKEQQKYRSLLES